MHAPLSRSAWVRRRRSRPGLVASKDDRARPKVAAMSRLSILAQGGSYGLGSATKEKAMKFEVIIQDDLFTFKPLDNAAVAWIRKSPWATRSGGDSG